MFCSVACKLSGLENCSHIASACSMFQESYIYDFPEDADFSNVKNAEKMFDHAKISFGNATDSRFKLTDFKSVENGKYMFSYCRDCQGHMAAFDMDALDIRNLKYGYRMFYCETITRMTSFKLQHLENAQEMFDCASFSAAKINEISLPAATDVRGFMCSVERSAN